MILFSSKNVCMQVQLNEALLTIEPSQMHKLVDTWQSSKMSSGHSCKFTAVSHSMSSVGNHLFSALSGTRTTAWCTVDVSPRNF